MISAILGKKLNMSVRFSPDGHSLPVTLIEAGPCVVVAKKNQEKTGFVAAVLEFPKTKKRTVRKEVKLTDGQDVAVGEKVTVANFEAGDLVKITGTSKGKGFAGVVKRFGFAGGPKTHGQSDRHRAPGSIGAGTDPGRVYKGKKMAGRMGDQKVTISKVEVIEVDKDKNLLVVKGPLPGHFKSIVFITKTGKAKIKAIAETKDESAADKEAKVEEETESQLKQSQTVSENAS